MPRIVQPAASSARVRQGYVELAAVLVGCADKFLQAPPRCPRHEGVDGHLSGQQHQPRPDDRQLGVQERAAERALLRGRSAVPRAGGRRTRKAASKRRQEHATFEVRWIKTRARKPGPQGTTSGAGEVAPSLSGDSARRLSDQHDVGRGQMVKERTGAPDVPSLLAGATGQHLLLEPAQRLHAGRQCQIRSNSCVRWLHRSRGFPRAVIDGAAPGQPSRGAAHNHRATRPARRPRSSCRLRRAALG